MRRVKKEYGWKHDESCLWFKFCTFWFYTSNCVYVCFWFLLILGICLTFFLGILKRKHRGLKCPYNYEEFKGQLAGSSEEWYETSLDLLGRKFSFITKQPRRKLAQIEYPCKEVEKNRYAGRVLRSDQRTARRRCGRTSTCWGYRKRVLWQRRVVVREDAETKKFRVVYDASVRAQEKAPSLNDCPHAGPPLQTSCEVSLFVTNFIL